MGEKIIRTLLKLRTGPNTIVPVGSIALLRTLGERYFEKIIPREPKRGFKGSDVDNVLVSLSETNLDSYDVALICRALFDSVDDTKYGARNMHSNVEILVPADFEILDLVYHLEQKGILSHKEEQREQIARLCKNKGKLLRGLAGRFLEEKTNNPSSDAF